MKIDTDKVDHGYMPTYRRLAAHLGPAAAVCEIGVWHGGSLAAWKSLFPTGLVVGVDVDPSSTWPDGTEQVIATQNDASLPQTLLDLSPSGFDLIVDDASHIGALSEATFRLLWPLVRDGGHYVLEDWMVGFPTWQGFDDSMLRLAQDFLLYLDTADSDVDSIEYRYGMALLTKRSAS